MLISLAFGCGVVGSIVNALVIIVDSREEKKVTITKIEEENNVFFAMQRIEALGSALPFANV